MRIFKGLFQKPLEARFGTAVPTFSDNKKTRRNPRFFRLRIISWGCPPQTPTQRTFREKSFGIPKASPKWNGIFGGKVLRIFKELFQKLLKARFGTAVPTFSENKKRGEIRVFFVCVISWGYPPQTRTQRTFCKKSFGISKTSPK